MFSESVKGVLPHQGPPSWRQDWIVTLFALSIPEWETHMLGLAVVSGEEAGGIEARHGPDPKSHRKVGPAVAIDAAKGVLGEVVGAGQISSGRRPKSCELLLVEVARDTKAIVALLLGKGPKKKKRNPNRQ
jgi:hypothetical protein